MARDASTDGEGDDERESRSATWEAGEEGLRVSDGPAVALSAMLIIVACALQLCPALY